MNIHLNRHERRKIAKRDGLKGLSAAAGAIQSTNAELVQQINSLAAINAAMHRVIDSNPETRAAWRNYTLAGAPLPPKPPADPAPLDHPAETDDPTMPIDLTQRPAVERVHISAAEWETLITIPDFITPPDGTETDQSMRLIGDLAQGLIEDCMINGDPLPPRAELDDSANPPATIYGLPGHIDHTLPRGDGKTILGNPVDYWYAPPDVIPRPPDPPDTDWPADGY